MRLADRMARLGTETAFEVLARARQLESTGRDIVHLEIGEPDFDTPRNVIDAGVRALRTGHTHYGPAAGIPELREAIAEDAGKRRGMALDPECVLVCPGGKPIMFYALLALINEGDEVIYPNPGFPIYESMIRFLGATPVALPLTVEKRFAFGVEDLESLITPRTRMLILNSPHNPTGGVLDADLLEAIADLAVRHDLIVLSDEIYSRLVYEGTHSSIATFPGMLERTILLDGFSKTFAMTGWRLGYGIVPRPLLAPLAKLQINAVSCTASFTQQAGIEALTGDQTAIEKMVAEFRARRDLLVDGLESIPGIRCLRPSGAFYVFPDVKDLGVPSRKLQDLLLEQGGVACLSGTAFGRHGEGFLRFSYANSQENLTKAIERIAGTLKQIPASARSSS